MADADARPTVLIVEDDDELRALMAYALEQEGYQAVTAAAGVEGLDKARAQHPDVILLDMMMAGLSGSDVLAMLQEHEETHNIPVIVVSAIVDRHAKRERIEGGADDYVTKPFDLDTLLFRILVALRRTQSPPP